MKLEIEFIETLKKIPVSGQNVLIVPRDSKFDVCEATYWGAPDYCFQTGVGTFAICDVSHWAEMPKNPNKKLEIGTAIKMARENRRMSQDTLAKRAGISTASVYNYESGKQDPQFRSIVRISDALDMKVQDLLGMIPD